MSQFVANFDRKKNQQAKKQTNKQIQETRIMDEKGRVNEEAQNVYAESGARMEWLGIRLEQRV